MKGEGGEKELIQSGFWLMNSSIISSAVSPGGPTVRPLPQVCSFFNKWDYIAIEKVTEKEGIPFQNKHST